VFIVEIVIGKFEFGIPITVIWFENGKAVAVFAQVDPQTTPPLGTVAAPRLVPQLPADVVTAPVSAGNAPHGRPVACVSVIDEGVPAAPPDTKAFVANIPESAGMLDAPKVTKSPLVPENAVPFILLTVTTFEPLVEASPLNSAAVIAVELPRTSPVRVEPVPVPPPTMPRIVGPAAQQSTTAKNANNNSQQFFFIFSFLYSVL
jgi:hypothetical protein